MRRRRLLAASATSLAGFAGCLSTGTSDEEEQSPDSKTTGTDRPDVSVEYKIRAGNIPDTLQSLGMKIQVVFVKERDELTACLRNTYTGPYKPTISPIPTPTSGACHLSQEFAFNRTEIVDGTSLGPVTAPGTYAAGHALVVTDVTATNTDGETAPVKGTGGHRANVVAGRPNGPYQVELGVETAPEGASYDYELVSSIIEPAN